MPDHWAGMVRLYVVESPITIATTIDPQRIIEPVTAVIPAAGAQIDTADETDGAIDYNKLLMMRGIEGVSSIVTELETIVGAPVEIPVLEPFPIEAVKHAVIPSEHEDSQRRLALAEFVEKFQKIDLTLGLGRVLAAQQSGIAVELPAEDKNILLRRQRRVVERTVIVPSIN